MADLLWTQLVAILKEQAIPFEQGLSDTEIRRIEGEFAFRFPPDLHAFLQAGLAVGEGFPNWRGEPRASLVDRLRLPLDGVLFDVEHNDFWLAEWGERPGSLNEALAMVGKLVALAPVLIPVYRHRMMPDRPYAPGNPVFSVHQTDIIYYGVDLRDYLIHEFLGQTGIGAWPITDSIRKIEFWDSERFQTVRWSRGSAVFDNRRGLLPGT